MSAAYYKSFKINLTVATNITKSRNHITFVLSILSALIKYCGLIIEGSKTNVLFIYLKFSHYTYLLWEGYCVSGCVWTSETSFRRQFSPSTRRVPGIELRSANSFVHQTILMPLLYLL